MTAPPFAEALRFWCKLGFISFGGPAGQIAIMHEELVVRRRWISEGTFLHALNFCMLLPGPEAQQLATYVGWRLHGLRGGLCAGVLFFLPSAALLWALSWLYLTAGDIPWVAAIFRGLEPAVLAIIAAAVLRIGSRALHNGVLWCLAAAAFVAIFFLNVSFVILIAAAGVIGLIGTRTQPRYFLPPLPPSDAPADALPLRSAQTASILFAGLALWLLPVGLCLWTLGPDNVFSQEGVFFSKAALVTFGGAYAVLPYVAQQAVEHFGWLTTPQMMAGLALAETTPGPLIMVLQFVGFVGGWQDPGALPPLVAGTLGAAITTWATFAPSLLLILLAAPSIERLRHVAALRGALTAITAAVVGVILNLAVWFALHALRPATGNIQWLPVLLTLTYFVALWRFRCGIVAIILLATAVAILIHLASAA